jgi:uncharacterized membrane protein YbhN (UPF0104 family)
MLTHEDMSAAVDTITPFSDESRARRVGKVTGWLGGIALVVVVLHLLGVDVRGWLSDFWEALTTVGLGYVVVALALQTVQTTLTALGWFFILRAAYPDAEIRFRSILAAYAAGLGLGFLPAHTGTLVAALMYVALIEGATFPGIVAAATVQKIFFTVASAFVYIYLFASVPGSFSLELGRLGDSPLLVTIVIAGGSALVAMLVRTFWDRLRGLWEKAKRGGAILARPEEYLVRVVLPSFGAWAAKLGVIAVFLTAFGIPVTFHTVMAVLGGNSLGSAVSVTPGGLGVNQAINAAALSDVTATATATAYSTSQHLLVTAWNILFAIAMVVWAFGWSRGRTLVASSYEEAKQQVAEQHAARAAKPRR